MRRTAEATLAVAGLLAIFASPVSGAALPPSPAAGGAPAAAAATSTVTFTVRPVILLVVSPAGRPAQLWTNIAGHPTAAQLRAIRVRAGGVHGRDLAITPALRAAAAMAARSADWGRQGLVWSRS